MRTRRNRLRFGRRSQQGGLTRGRFVRRLCRGTLLLAVVAALSVGGRATADSNSQTFTSSGTWVAPADVFSVQAECRGGGGGGGIGSGSGAAGGGGGGAYARRA